MTRPNPHDLKLLGVTSTATLADLNRAFRARARTLHPDRGGDPPHLQGVKKPHQRLMEAPARPAPTRLLKRKYIKQSTRVPITGVANRKQQQQMNLRIL